jgi:hypothetical protein
MVNLVNPRGAVVKTAYAFVPPSARKYVHCVCGVRASAPWARACALATGNGLGPGAGAGGGGVCVVCPLGGSSPPLSPGVVRVRAAAESCAARRAGRRPTTPTPRGFDLIGPRTPTQSQPFPRTIVFEQKERDYLLWCCFRSGFASPSTPAGCLNL